MVSSDRQRLANRNNATLSTGPRTQRGKFHSRNNALRHGLARPVHADPALKDELEALARIIADDSSNPCELAIAMLMAECHLDQRRVDNARTKLMEEFGNPANLDVDEAARLLKELDKIARYQRRAFSNLRKAMRLRSI